MEVNNDYEKNLKFEQLHREVKQIMDNDKMYINNLCFKYAQEKYPLSWVWSTTDSKSYQTNFINQCLKNNGLIEDFLIRDIIIETTESLFEFWLEISWLQSIWRSWASLIAYLTWYITDDKYLTDIAKQNLRNDLAAVSQELNVLGRIKKLNKFRTNLFNERITKILLTHVKWSTVNKPDLSKMQNQKLFNIAYQNYRDWSKIWKWSVADAIRYQKVTWLLVWGKDHIEKWKLDSDWLRKLIEWWIIWDSDKSVASKILNDLTNALNGN